MHGGPEVEMLWESHDAHEALGTRFGFADAAEASAWVTGVVRDHWGLRVDSCERIVISDRNALAWLTGPSGRLLAKWSVAVDRFPRLRQVAALTRWLGGCGLPVSPPLETPYGAVQVEPDGASVCLQRVVDGHLLDVDDDGQVDAAGATLARLHLALGRYPDAAEVVAEPGPRPLGARVCDWADSAGAHLPEPALSALRGLVAAAPVDPGPTQLVHGDFRSSNVLVRGTEVAAVLDLEEVRVDHCVDELARSAVLLGTRFRDWGRSPHGSGGASSPVTSRCGRWLRRSGPGGTSWCPGTPWRWCRPGTTPPGGWTQPSPTPP